VRKEVMIALQDMVSGEPLVINDVPKAPELQEIRNAMSNCQPLRSWPCR